MRHIIQALVFDIDGVITDGRKYTDGISQEIKSVAYKDMDAITAFRKEGVLVGCISGEDTPFSRSLAGGLDFGTLGKKDKLAVLKAFCREYGLDREKICYVGDGKYDLEAIRYAGIGACPHDGLGEVKQEADIILNTSGGQGCIAELYTWFWRKVYRKEKSSDQKACQNAARIHGIETIVHAHVGMAERILADSELLHTTEAVCREIMNTYRHGGRLFLCGNGGSAADAQHLAAEMVGRFYLERKGWPAEALTTDSSVITALANDYDYNMVFARQVEAKGMAGDVLVGITTSGKSENILKAFDEAEKKGMTTVLMTGGKGGLPLIRADYILRIPSEDTPRIQEGHMLIGHIMCELIEAGLTEGE